MECLRPSVEAPIWPRAQALEDRHIHLGTDMVSTVAIIDWEAQATHSMGCSRNGNGPICASESHPWDLSAISQTGIEFLNLSNSLNAFNRVHQGQYESLGDYKQRFELALEDLEAIDHLNIPAEGARVSQLIKSLNWNEWKQHHDLMNGIRKGRVKPLGG